MLFGSLAALIAVPFWLVFIFSGNVLWLLASNLVLLALSLVWLGPAAADVHDIAGPELRGLGIGVYFFAVIIAYGIGSLVIGQVNDWLDAATTPLNMRFSMLLCPLACLVAALSLWQGFRAAKHL
jgi:predicted MFS family arabinose efflux permease